MIPFNQEEMGVLYGAVQEALQGIKTTEGKTKKEIEGDIYTNLRRALSCSKRPQEPLLQIVRGRKRMAHGDKWVFIQRMISDMKTDYLKDSENSLAELRNAMAGIDNAVCKLTFINQEGEEVLKEIAKIDTILNPHGEKDE